MKELLRRMRKLSPQGRSAQLAEIAEQYGDGFAEAVCREFEKSWEW